MPNTIEAAEMLEERIEGLRSLLASQEKLAKVLGDDSIDNVIQGTKNLIKTNEATAKHIRETAIDG